MAGGPSNQDYFDLRKIRRLVELMNEHDLTEIDLRQGDVRIQLRRGGEPCAMPPMMRMPAAVAAAIPQEPRKPDVAAEAAEIAEEHIVVVKSPMVGTFYASPDPDSPPYVKVGDHVGPDTVACIVEAMKVFNQIPAEVSGKVVAVLVGNGEPVEFGQPMFKVDTRK